MARQRSHSIAFKRQVAQEFVAGETLYGLAKRHDLSRQLIRVWVQKYETGALDEDALQCRQIIQRPYQCKSPPHAANTSNEKPNANARPSPMATT